MAKQAKQAPSSRIEPGQSQKFIYVGESIPNSIVVKNLGTTAAPFRLTSTSPGWLYYGRVGSRAGVFVSVEFPNGRFTVHNDGSKPIEVGGDGIRPA
jgi:hypothetical protein